MYKVDHYCHMHCCMHCIVQFIQLFSKVTRSLAGGDIPSFLYEGRCIQKRLHHIAPSNQMMRQLQGPLEI